MQNIIAIELLRVRSDYNKYNTKEIDICVVYLTTRTWTFERSKL